MKQWGGNVVDIIIYGTEKTLDAYKFNLLRNKQLFINPNQQRHDSRAPHRRGRYGRGHRHEFCRVRGHPFGQHRPFWKRRNLTTKLCSWKRNKRLSTRSVTVRSARLGGNRQEIDTCKRNIGRMTKDWEYFNTHKEDCAIEINGDTQLTAEERGRALHTLSRKHRGDFTPIGCYNGLRLLVRSEYRLDGSFDRNTFFVEGKSGLKYKCGMSGSLPPSFAAAAVFPQTTLENHTQADGTPSRAAKTFGGRNHHLATSDGKAMGQGRTRDLETAQTGV